MMVIILISGKQGSGKSTLAKSVGESFPERPFHQLRFAQPLYEMHDKIRSILKSYDYQNYDYSKKDGDLLQLLGTEWGREKVDQSIWVQLLLNKLRQLPKNSIVTVEDCRFENEFDAFIGVPNCISVRLEASRATRKHRASYWRKLEDHPSEIGLDHYAAMGKFDFVFDADKMCAFDILTSVEDKVKQLLKNDLELLNVNPLENLITEEANEFRV
jgi:hypothetical protein